MFSYDSDTTEVMIADENEYELAEDVDYGALQFAVHIEAGRDDEPEDGKINIRSHYLLEVWADDGEKVVTLRAGPVFTLAARTTEDLAEFCKRLVDSIEEDMNGVKEATVEYTTTGSEDLAIEITQYGNELEA